MEPDSTTQALKLLIGAVLQTATRESRPLSEPRLWQAGPRAMANLVPRRRRFGKCRWRRSRVARDYLRLGIVLPDGQRPDTGKQAGIPA